MKQCLPGLAIKNNKHGFTLVELLLAIGIVAVLASITIAAMNPNKQIRDARNAQRRSDVNTILNAVYQYMLDYEGQMPPGIGTESKGICKASASCNNGVSSDPLIGDYISDMPADPIADATGTGTDYFIFQDNFGRITITAPNAELGISISR